MNPYFAHDAYHYATLNEREAQEALADYIRDMGPVDECPAWCPFRDAFGLCGYRWPDCKLVEMLNQVSNA